MDAESDSDIDYELLDDLRKAMLEPAPASTTGVLESAKFIFDNSIDVALNMRATKAAAEQIYCEMVESRYSVGTWSTHELHPKNEDSGKLNFIFTMDLLNFSFWSDQDDASQSFCVKYGGKVWKGYWSLVACLRRALDEGVPITSPQFWVDVQVSTDDALALVFRTEGEEAYPLVAERIRCLRQAGRVICDMFGGKIASLVRQAEGSAVRLVHILVENFDCFRDESWYDGEHVKFYKRAQILVADLWAAYEGQSYGQFEDIDGITMFADYRIPQTLFNLKCISYSPALESQIRRKKTIENGHPWEVQLRGCSIWAVEKIRCQIKHQHPQSGINAILIDFFLYDLAKENEKRGHEQMPHHRTRTIWY